MAKIGIYGGSFDPPHLGHILALKEFQRKLSLDRVIVIPAKDPPHKLLTEGAASAEDRLAMTRLAVQDIPFAEVSDLELCREGKSYTAHTLQQLRAVYPQDDLYLLMGTDMFLSFSTWFEPEKIVEQATLVAAYRMQEPDDRMQLCAQRLQREMGATCILLGNEFLPYSSTCTRAMMAFRCGEDYVPEAVFAYIREHGLYYAGQDLKRLDFPTLRRISLSLHDRKRVPHVTGCSDTAFALAKQFGADPEDARRAGILHDITKALGPQDQLKLCQKYAIIIDNFYQNNPKLLHAKTGSVIARQIFGENDSVCEAICWHTTGKADMNDLEKILYLADYVEPNRTFDTVHQLRELTYRDLDAAMALGLKMTMEQLSAQDRQIDPNSLAALRFFTERNS